MNENIGLVKRLAKSAMLSFTDDQLKDMTKDMEEIIKLIEPIRSVDITIVEPTKEQVNFEELRVDKQGKSLTKEEILINAPKTKSGNFEVAMVVE